MRLLEISTVAMPSSLHPQAKFDPIPPDLDLHGLVRDTANFEWATNISASEIFTLGQQRFEKLVYYHVINGGKPLVICNWNERLPKKLFSPQWLQEHYDKKEENVWDINNKCNIPMTMGHYLRSMKQLADQWTPRNFRDERRQRLYLKDMDCPPGWQERLKKALPRSIFYLNENVELQDRSNEEVDDDDVFVNSQQVARAGDLMSSLPVTMRAENLMCYIGHEGTYTPAHREMCASLGQNIMVEASGTEAGEKPGSSIWFMTETKDREVVGEYFLSMLGHDVEIEKHFAQINAWKKATFPVYIVEQRPGDLILVPPLAPHQVWNRGTRTMKVAWNRTVVETLEMALHEALPKARLVCRDEQYKNKAIVYYTLTKYYKELSRASRDQYLASFGIAQDLPRQSARAQQVTGDFRRLLQLFTEVLVDEMFGARERAVEYVPFDSNITCSYCRANIFNRFLTCKHCVRKLVDGDDDTYDVCMECYAMGRSCACVSGLHWCEQWPWEELVGNYELWRALVIANDGFVDAFATPSALLVARQRAGRKSVAQICQEQLRLRPFRDIHQPVKQSGTKMDEEPSEPEVDDDGRVVRKKKQARKAKKGDTYRCHSCCHKDHRYRLAFCSTPGCQEAYCYGVLYRGFDLMPQTVMQQEYWRCPRCMNICNCGSCRRAGQTTPYVPKGTLLGHDTRPIADDRSVEALINFRLHNLLWLRNGGEEGRSKDSKRMKRLRQAADEAKAAGGGVMEVDVGDFGMQNSEQGSEVNEDRQGYTIGSYPGSSFSAADGLADVPSAPLGLSVSALATQSPQTYPDPTGYPDPSTAAVPNDDMMALFGRAYYQDDDSPNKILFDPYCEPLPHQIPVSMDLLDEPPEFLDNFTRPVRRSRHEKDIDPDYQGPRSHSRKKTRPPNDAAAELEMHLDPALLTTHPVVPTSLPREDLAPAAIMDGNTVHAPSNKTTDNSEDEDNDSNSWASSPTNVRELRHARPKASYIVEMESDGENEAVLQTGPRLVLAQEDRRQADPMKHLGPEEIAMVSDDLSAGQMTRQSGDASVENAQDGPDKDENMVAEEPKKRPGRSSKRPTSVGSGTVEVQARTPSPPDMQFLSMAERMALRGRKFRIGRGSKRGGSRGTEAMGAPPATTEGPSLAVQIGIPKRQESEQKETMSKVELSVPTVSLSGPTVVRLAESEDSNSDGSDGGEADHTPKFFARRGGIRGGRGRGRGRGRGQVVGRR